MALKLVTQTHYNGCIVACVAMLLGKTYEEAFALVNPGADPLKWEGFVTKNLHQDLIVLMDRLGFKLKRSSYKRLKSLQRYVKKNTLLVIRWREDGYMCHSVVYDAETKQFLDPCGNDAEPVRELQRNLEAMYYVVPKAA